MAISLTQPAADRVKNHLETRGKGIGLRLGVKKTGCNGFAYVVNYADVVNEGDVVFEDNGVTVVVDPQSLELIDGTVVDFVKEGLNEAFSFRNPNVNGECGCPDALQRAELHKGFCKHRLAVELFKQASGSGSQTHDVDDDREALYGSDEERNAA